MITRQDIRTDWSEAELAAIERMAVEQDLSPAQLMRQAVRLYQLHTARLAAGETCHYSGDAERARAFAGAGLDTACEADALNGGSPS